jgi:hypothetical protein
MTNVNENVIGKKIVLITMSDDPNPIPSGTIGTIYNVGGGVLNVKWENGRTLGIIEGVDMYDFI